MDLQACISEKTQGGRKLLAPYLCAGFPSPELTLELLDALVAGGADVIELGVPYSDPLADGPVLQAASQQALAQGMTLDRTLTVAAAFTQRHPGVPLLLMSYLNPLLAFGAEALGRRAEAGGVAGLLVPDLPLEDDALLATPGMPPRLPFVAPTTGDARLAQVGQGEPAFVYAVSVLGVTGARRALPTGTEAFLRRARAGTGRPVLAGFGISEPQQARAMAEACDGVIIGSALANHVAAAADPVAAARDFLAPFRQSLDRQESSCC